ncbi:general stress protein [Candidatus Parcubacteria bacterium]|nr:MAG: general stress protein [Candidatus Parcubacteria bacterium]
MAKLIAEVCQNHKGDRRVLRDMIQRAAEAGADIVKGQIIFSEDLHPRERFETGVVESNGVRKAIQRPFEPEKARLASLDLAEDDYHFFIEEAHRAGVAPMMTVFAKKRIPFAASLPWKEKLVKVASYDCASFPMLRDLTGSFDRLVVSTGATLDDEIAKASEILKASGKPYAMLHCVTSYPNTLAMSNLARMDWLRQFAPEVGWSDHTLVARDGIKAAKAALALGADYIERHFTILPADATKDGPVSINPDQLRELADFAKRSREERMTLLEREIPDWRVMLGSATRDMTHTEMLNRDYYRGRFASNIGGEWVQNWDERSLAA